MTVRAIFAMDDEGGIGKNGTLPWPHNSADLKWFKERTNGHIVMMGRRTWEDPNMPKPLPNRYNIVVSDGGLISSDTRPNMVIRRSGVKRYLDLIDGDVWIIGGAQLLKSTIQYVDEIWLSRICGTYDCDTFIEAEGSSEFKLFEKHYYFDDALTIEKLRRVG